MSAGAASEPSVAVRCPFHLAKPTRRKELRAGAARAAVPAGSVPRVARLLALAHHYERLIATGVVRDQADLARLVGVSRARITQVMDLLLLAPAIQEQILFMPRVERGRDPISMCDLGEIARTLDWQEQRSAWKEVARWPDWR